MPAEPVTQASGRSRSERRRRPLSRSARALVRADKSMAGHPALVAGANAPGGRFPFGPPRTADSRSDQTARMGLMALSSKGEPNRDAEARQGPDRKNWRSRSIESRMPEPEPEANAIAREVNRDLDERQRQGRKKPE